MLIVKTTLPHISNLTEGEPEFEIRDGSGEEYGQYRAVRVHPWSRRYLNGDPDRSVYVSVGNYDPDGTEQRDSNGGQSMWNIIVDREEFVLGILGAFPELKRA